MPTRTIRPVLDRLATHLQPWTDAEALGRFVRGRDEAAFAHLVRRYGPLVAGVCRRVLGLRPEADDAVQATFWALAKQAGSIRDPRTLPAWLHAVAYRAARKAARPALALSPSAVPVAPDDPLAEASWREVRRLLDEEVRRLPQKLRLPILLCYFEELTRDEAAERLGWSLSTVKRRLDLARDRLKARLGRRGVEPRLLGAAGLLGGGLSAQVAPALERACSNLLHESPSAAVRCLAAGPTVARWLIPLTVLVGFGGTFAFLGGQGPAAKPPTADSKPVAVVPEPAPAGAVRFGTSRYRSNSGFWFGSFSRDGRWFVSGTEGVELWDMETGLARQLCPIRNNTVPRPAISPDGTVVAVLDGGPGVHLLDAKTGVELRVVGTEQKYDEARFSADGKRIFATKYEPGPVAKGFTVADGTALVEHKFPTAIRYHLDVWDGRPVYFLVSEAGPADGADLPVKVRITDVETGKDLKTFDVVLTEYADAPRPVPAGRLGGRRAQPFERTSFAIDPAATQVAYLRSGGTVGLAPLTPGGKARTIDPFAGRLGDRKAYPNCVWFAPDGKTLFVDDYSGTIVRCDAATGEVLGTFTGHRSRLGMWNIDPPGDRLTTAGHDGHLRRWDLKTNREIPLAPGYSTAVRAVLSPDGVLAIVGDKAGAIDVYEAKTGKLRHALPRPAEACDWCIFELSPDGRTLAATRPEGTILWWDMVASKELATTTIPGPKPNQLYNGIEAMAFSPDGKRLACGHPNGGLTVLDTATRTEVWRIGLPADPPGADYAKGVSVSADGVHVARVLRVWDRTPGQGRIGFAVQVLDAATGRVVKWRMLFDGPLGGGTIGDVSDLRYTSDGRHLVALCRDGRVLVLDPHTLLDVAVWATGTRDGFALGVSPDGRMILTGDETGTTKLWEIATGKPMGSIPGHRGHIVTAAVSTDGRFLLTGGYDHVAYARTLAPMQSAESGNLIDRLRGDNAEAARRAVWALAADPKGPDLVRAAVKPVDGPKPEAVRKWVVDLDNPGFAKREAASRELIALGRFAEPAVRAALAAGPTAEARERLEKVLAGLPKRPSKEEVVQTRAVQAMELAGAESVLKEWAAGAAGAWLTVEARAALRRLGR